jgi:hypothetical protein
MLRPLRLAGNTIGTPGLAAHDAVPFFASLGPDGVGFLGDEASGRAGRRGPLPVRQSTSMPGGNWSQPISSTLLSSAIRITRSPDTSRTALLGM